MTENTKRVVPRYYLDGDEIVRRCPDEPEFRFSLSGSAPAALYRLAAEGAVHFHMRGFSLDKIMEGALPDRSLPSAAKGSKPSAWGEAIIAVRAAEALAEQKAAGVAKPDRDAARTQAAAWYNTLSKDDRMEMRQLASVIAAHAKVAGKAGSLEDALKRSRATSATESSDLSEAA